MKILIITAGFFPGQKYGGPPVSVDNFCTLMNDSNIGDKHECLIVTQNHDLGETKPYDSVHEGWNDRGNAKVLYMSSKGFNYRTFYKIIKEQKPDLLYLQSLFSSYTMPSLMAAKSLNVRTFLAPRGEICIGAFDKKYKKIPYIYLMRMLGLLTKIFCQSTCEEETVQIQSILKVPQNRIFAITNIPSIPKTQPIEIEKKKGEVRLVFVSRVVSKKNIKFAIESLAQVKGDVVYDIYGPLEQKKYWEECEQAIAKLSANVKVNYCGLISHDDVHATFNKYHGFLFPTFSENYGQVIAESLLVGCPVIISDQTPWTDVNENKAGWAIPLSEPQRYTDAVQSLVDMEQKEFSEIHKNALNYVARKTKLDVIKQAYEAILKK